MDCRFFLQDPDLNSFGYRPRNGIVGSSGRPIFNFLRNLHTVLHSSCTILHSSQQCVRFWFFCILANIYFLFGVLVTAILTGVRWYPIAVLMWFADIFSHSMGCHFFLWLFPLLCRSLLVWYSPTCLFLLLLPVFLVSYHKIIAKTIVMKFSLMLSSRSFTVSSLLFKSLVLSA